MATNSIRKSIVPATGLFMRHPSCEL
jgi:hypothetical protein